MKNITVSSPQASAPRRSSGVRTLIVLLGMALLLLGISLALNFIAVDWMARAGDAILTGEKGEDEFPEFHEIHSWGSGTTKVVRIVFNGVITRSMEGGWFGSTDPVEEAIRQIRAARQDPAVRGILLEVDSPGGGVTSADEIHRELCRFRESDSRRRVVTLVHDMAASGGYYIALPSDRIRVQPTSMIGSIGVILQSVNFQVLSEKLGVTDVTIKSGKNKDLLNPFQPVDPEQKAILQESVDAMYGRFVKLVAEGRGLSEKAVRPLADGRVFTAEEALQHRLVDSIGYWEDAVADMADLLGGAELYVVTYQTNTTLWEDLFGARSPLSGLSAWARSVATPRRHYLWRP